MSNASRSPKGQDQEKSSLSLKISDFLRKYRIVLLAVLGAAVLAIVVVALWSTIHGSAVKASTAKIEKLDDDIAAYSAEQDQAKKAELEKAIASGLDEVIGKWPRLYAGQRAHAMKARLAAEKKDWAASEKEWLETAGVSPSSYLAPVALQGAAVAAEERGAPEKAVEYYKRLVGEYPKAAGVAHAYFALGRLAEDSKDYSAAVVHYEKVVASFPNDDWTKLAKDRILSLKSRGLAK
jgi:tetratricopeptide (TPR) repeat protein